MLQNHINSQDTEIIKVYHLGNLSTKTKELANVIEVRHSKLLYYLEIHFLTAFIIGILIASFFSENYVFIIGCLFMGIVLWFLIYRATNKKRKQNHYDILLEGVFHNEVLTKWKDVHSIALIRKMRKSGTWKADYLRLRTDVDRVDLELNELNFRKTELIDMVLFRIKNKK